MGEGENGKGKKTRGKKNTTNPTQKKKKKGKKKRAISMPCSNELRASFETIKVIQVMHHGKPHKYPPYYS